MENTNICLEVSPSMLRLLLIRHVCSDWVALNVLEPQLLNVGVWLMGLFITRFVLRYSVQKYFIWYCNSLLLFQYLLHLISAQFHLDVSAWDLCCDGRHMYNKMCQTGLAHCSITHHMLTAAGVWPDCQLETNLFCWARQWGYVRRQLTSRIGFIVAVAVNSKVVGL